jgi:hypothetical protein
MANLGTYVFKPKYDIHITQRIIDTFTQEWLGWNHSGAHIYWHDRVLHGHRELPEGYIKFDIEMECGSMEDFSETCWHEDPVSAEHLTNDLFVLLIESGFFDDGEYHFLDRELTEVISALSANESRLLAFWADRCLVMDIDKRGVTNTKQQDMSSLMLTVEI